MDDGLQIVAFTRVWRLEEIEQLVERVLCTVLLNRLGIKHALDYYAEEKLVDHLQMRPRFLDHYLVVTTFHATTPIPTPPVREERFITDLRPFSRFYFRRAKQVLPNHGKDLTH